MEARTIRLMEKYLTINSIHLTKVSMTVTVYDFDEFINVLNSNGVDVKEVCDGVTHHKFNVTSLKLSRSSGTGQVRIPWASIDAFLNNLL